MRIGTLYFDGGKLKEWVGQGQQTMALFEKIKTVGKGESGCIRIFEKIMDYSSWFLIDFLKKSWAIVHGFDRIFKKSWTIVHGFNRFLKKSWTIVHGFDRILKNHGL